MLKCVYFFYFFDIFDKTASRKHGLIEVSQDGRVFFVDVGSSNGTEVDMIHISTHGRVQLKSGSRIRIGDTYYFCLLEDGGKQKMKAKKINDKNNKVANEFLKTNRKTVTRPVVQLPMDGQETKTTTRGGQKQRQASKQANRSPVAPSTSSTSTAPIISTEKTQKQQLKMLLQNLIDNRKGHYTDAKKAVSVRWGPTYFKKNRDVVRTLLEELKNAPSKSTNLTASSSVSSSVSSSDSSVSSTMSAKKTVVKKINVPETGADALLRDLGISTNTNTTVDARNSRILYTSTFLQAMERLISQDGTLEYLEIRNQLEKQFNVTLSPKQRDTIKTKLSQSETNDEGKYSKRCRSNIAVIIVRIIFISAFLFYCLLLNHSFPTNPNSITNSFKLYSLLQLYNYICSLLSRYFDF